MDRFVYIAELADTNEGTEDGYLAVDGHAKAWGLVSDVNGAFAPLYGPDLKNIEFGKPTGLWPEETQQIVDATPENTPDEAWTALAVFRLVGVE